MIEIAGSERNKNEREGGGKEKWIGGRKGK